MMIKIRNRRVSKAGAGWRIAIPKALQDYFEEADWCDFTLTSEGLLITPVK
jgi:hypothetical protein